MIYLAIFSTQSKAQTETISPEQEIHSFQKELNEEFKDAKKSPLKGDDFKNFESHTFYPIDLSFRVVVKLKVISDSPFLPMKTTSSRIKDHRIYAFAEFILKGKSFSIPVYQSKDLLAKKEYADYLFFPFTDLTNGKETYGGGRYIDLRIPKTGDQIVIDFNKAYNPFCAYSSGYSCPLVPSENNLDLEVFAGVKYRGKY